MRILLSCFFTFLIALSCHCQVCTVLSGTVISDSGSFYMFGKIYLKDQKDSTKKIAATTNARGQFVFSNINYGVYEISIVREQCSQAVPVTVDQYIVKLKDIQLSNCPKILQGVTVTNPTRKIEHKLDRLVFNASKSILAENSTLWETLTLIPTVRTETSSGVSVGEKTASIYIDDVPVQLGGADLVSFLRSYSASGVEKIEVFDIAPAKYDANGGAIINIILKRRLKDGLYGDAAVNYEQSTYDKYRITTTLNGKQKKIEFFLNGNLSFGKYLATDKEYINYLNSGVISNWNIDSRLIEKRPSNNLVAGLRFLATKRSSFGIQYNRNYISSTANSGIFTTATTQKNIDSSINTRNESVYQSVFSNVNEYYKHSIDTTGGVFQISANQLFYNNSPLQTLSSSTYDASGNFLTKYKNISESVQSIKVYSVQTDLSKTWSHILFETGIKAYQINTRSERSLLNQSVRSQNDFLYTEKNGALYFSMSKSWKRISAKAGLRGEYTDLHIHSSSESYDSTNTSRYFKLFPTAYVQYSFDDNHQLIISANRRITRPDYYRLNPFVYYTTPYHTTSGNPYLQPSIQYAFQSDYIINNNYTLSLFYLSASNKFTNITLQDNQTKLFQDIQRNIGQSRSAGTSLYFDQSPEKWWQMSHFIRLAYKTEQSDYLNQSYSFHKFVYYYSFDNTFILDSAKKWTGDLHFYYASPTIQGIFNNDKMYNLSLGIRKRIKNISFTFTINDLFFSDYSKIDVRYLDQNNGFVYKNDSRSVSFGLRYSFNRKSGKNRDIEKIGNSTEADRVDITK